MINAIDMYMVDFWAYLVMMILPDVDACCYFAMVIFVQEIPLVVSGLLLL